MMKCINMVISVTRGLNARKVFIAWVDAYAVLWFCFFFERMRGGYASVKQLKCLG